MTETIGRWRGQHEDTSLASADRARQKSECAEAEAAGTWSEEAETVEKDPDEDAGKLDWELKTQARKRIREAAEAGGRRCYYPDGSFRDDSSGWGWVVQQNGEELARDCGPVRLYGVRTAGWERSTTRTTQES